MGKKSPCRRLFSDISSVSAPTRARAKSVVFCRLRSVTIGAFAIQTGC